MRRSMLLPAKLSAAQAGDAANAAAATRPARSVLGMNDIEFLRSMRRGAPRRKLGHPGAGDNRADGATQSRVPARLHRSRQSGPSMLHRPGVTQDLARFIVATGWSEIPPGIVHEAKRALVNFFAVALAGCRGGPVEVALQSLAAFSGRQQATVIGRGERMDALSAAFLNAAAANVLDFDDTHVPTAIHPSAPVTPALFALAELRPVTGRDLLAGFVLGVEIECRIGGAIFPGHYTKGWHITATCGVRGAAAGAGKRLGPERERMVFALGNAATQSSGLCECLGFPAKSIGVGNAARNGLWSALLAEKGFEGPPEPIAGGQGFLNAMAEPPNWTLLTGGLGETWALKHNAIKPYPCGFVIHPFLDCVLEWRRAHPGAGIERVVLRGNPLLSDRTDRPT